MFALAAEHGTMPDHQLGAILTEDQAMLSDERRASGRFGAAVPVPVDAPVRDRPADLAGRTP